MTKAPDSAGTSSPLTGVEDAHPRRSRWSSLLPTLTFVAGLVLGAGVVAAGGGGGGSPAQEGAQPAAAPPAEPSPAPADLLVRVPEPCLAAADEAERAFTVFDSAVDAARRLDARTLTEVVDDVQALRPRVQELAGDCRDRAGQDVLDGSTTTSAPRPGA